MRSANTWLSWMYVAIRTAVSDQRGVLRDNTWKMTLEALLDQTDQC